MEEQNKQNEVNYIIHPIFKLRNAQLFIFCQFINTMSVKNCVKIFYRQVYILKKIFSNINFYLSMKRNGWKKVF